MTMKPANHFSITTKEIEATIDTSTIDGKQAISLSFKGRPVDNPRLESGADGSIVTAELESITDEHSVHLRLFIPNVNVQQESVPISTIALLTTVRSSLGGPQLVEGQIDLYEVQPGAGLATAIES
jgi:hypothetical protein